MAKNRQLAAIMFTDIAGYTAMMQENERAAAEVRQKHREVFQREHQNYFGEVLQYYGDGTLSIFKSAVEAVECAVAMQQEFAAGKKVDVRIGIHLGDIVFEETEVYGDGVNLASRVESLGVPGSILISDKVNYSIKNQNTIKTHSLGFFEFKNISDPVEIFAVTNKGVYVPQRKELKGKLKDKKKSIAVLPFVNMSPDPDNEYFSDGISEEILNALAKVNGFKVTARTSSFSFKGKNMDVREIGTQLGVEHILEGSVRKAGNRVRVTAQLVSSIDGYHFFSETYDRNLEDIFAVQDEIAQKITNRLREHLAEAQHEMKLVEAPTSNLAAYELYLKGVYFHNQWGDEAFKKAVSYFNQAIELEKDFVLPHAKMILCHMFSAFAGGTWKDAYDNALPHIEKVEQLGAKAPEVFFAKFVFNFFFKWDWKAAIEACEEGLAQFPNYPSLYHAASTMYYVTNDLEPSRTIHKRGLDIDPLSIEMILYMGIAYLWDRNYEKALKYLNQVLEMIPDNRVAIEYTGWLFAWQGKHDKALPYFEKLEPAMGYRLHKLTCLGLLYFKTGETQKSEGCLEELRRLNKLPDAPDSLKLDLATLYCGMGNYDEALEYLDAAIRIRFGDTMMVRSDPFFDDLKELPGFQELLELIGEVPPFDFL